ncbi:MAG: DUF2933 domain-containing protein [Egibacteraceae bacterium]
MQHLKHCINPKVIAGLAAVAAGVWVFAPGAFAAALPLLILAICPLSMIGMMYMMRGSGQQAGSGGGASCHTQGAGKEPVTESASQEDARGIEALRAQVAELEARLAVEARPKEATADQSAVRDAD